MLEMKEYLCVRCGIEMYSDSCLCSQCAALIAEETKMKLQPVGVTPKEIWIRQRIYELNAAIKRYLDAELIVPREWYIELEEHIRGLQRVKVMEHE